MSETKKAEKPKKLSGKEQGRSFGWCLGRAKLYSQDVKGPWPFLYIIPLSLAWLVCDLTLRCHYSDVGVVDQHFLPANLFTVGWTALMVGLVMALPWKAKWPVRCIPLMFCMACMETHSGFYNFFQRFFSLSVLTYATGNDNFVKREYIHIDGPILAGAISTIILMMCSGRLLQVIPPRTTKKTVAAGLIVAVIGGGLIGWTAHTYFPVQDTVIYAMTDEKDINNNTYQSFTDTTNCLMLSGLYQYTARDIWQLVRPDSTMSERDRREVESYISQYEKTRTDNEFTGALAGRNLILVQLEAMDTWLIDPDYTPTLARLKEEGISFTNHYTPAYITAGTFNTEFMVNTSLLPATGNISTTVYARDDFPCSLANLFRNAGYSANSFHNSEGDVYDRGIVHPNLGYESYTGGNAMNMPDRHMDRYLINGFDNMVSDDHPFFTFVITYSAHGTYGPENPIYLENAAEAQAKARRTDGNYVYAVAGAMETERFVADLVKKLEESGHLDDTVLVFYADHYDYYMLDDELEMEIKGVDNLNMLQHTDFFLWSSNIQPRQVDKVTASVDILPTLANLFGLDTSGAVLIGHDGLGDEGGYVFFNDGSWFDGETYWDSAGEEPGDPERTAEINTVRTLSNKVLAGNYYGK